MVDGARFESQGNLTLAFATWVCRLHAAGIAASDAEIAAAVDAVAAAPDREQGDAAGARLVEWLERALSEDPSPDGVLALARRLYGEAVAGDLGDGSREVRTARIRRYQFGRTLPWLARIIERHASGVVAPSWLLVERLTDQVRALDPNPWNDLDEERQLPVQDFLVLWELDGCPSVYVR